MKRVIIQVFNVFVGILFTTLSIAQPQIEWVSKYVSGQGEKVIQTNDGGYAIAATCGIPSDSEWCIRKIDVNGETEWSFVHGASGNDRPKDIQQTLDNGFLITGGFADGGDFTVIKLDSMGSQLWKKTFGALNDDANSLVLTSDGGFVLAGTSQLFSQINSYGLVKKLDIDGNLQWEKRFGGSHADELHSIKQTNDFGYIASGYSKSMDGDVGPTKGANDVWIIKMDESGNLEWSKTYGGSGNDESLSVQLATDGGYIVAGSSDSTNGDIANNFGDFDMWLLKIDQDGEVVWERTYGGTDEEKAQTVRSVLNGGYIVAGWSKSGDGDVAENRGNTDVWILKIDNQGIVEWAKIFGGSGYDRCFDIRETSDEGYILTGWSGEGDGDFENELDFDGGAWVMKLSSYSTGLSEKLQSHFTIAPNPNDGNFHIISDFIDGPIDIIIFDMSGNIVYSKTYTNLNKPISMQYLTTGLYNIELVKGGMRYISKIILEK